MHLKFRVLINMFLFTLALYLQKLKMWFPRPFVAFVKSSNFVNVTIYGFLCSKFSFVIFVICVTDSYVVESVLTRLAYVKKACRKINRIVYLCGLVICKTKNDFRKLAYGLQLFKIQAKSFFKDLKGACRYILF